MYVVIQFYISNKDYDEIRAQDLQGTDLLDALNDAAIVEDDRAGVWHIIDEFDQDINTALNGVYDASRMLSQVIRTIEEDLENGLEM